MSDERVLVSKKDLRFIADTFHALYDVYLVEHIEESGDFLDEHAEKAGELLENALRGDKDYD